MSALLMELPRAALTAAAVIGVCVFGSHAVAQASPPPPNPNATGQVVYLVNDSSGELVFDGSERSANIADRSDSVAPGETGYVKSTSSIEGPSFTYVVGDPSSPAGSVYITTTLDENDLRQTTCRPSEGLLCTVSTAQQGNWPSAVTIADSD